MDVADYDKEVLGQIKLAPHIHERVAARMILGVSVIFA